MESLPFKKCFLDYTKIDYKVYCISKGTVVGKEVLVMRGGAGRERRIKNSGCVVERQLWYMWNRKVNEMLNDRSC